MGLRFGDCRVGSKMRSSEIEKFFMSMILIGASL